MKFLLIFVLSLPTFLFAQHSNYFFKSEKTIVIAHRGDHTNAPENTDRAILDAITSGADYVEVDIRTTRDGYLIVMHDATVDRMTNGKGNVKDLLLSEVQQLEVTDKKRPELGKYKVLTFEDVIELCHNRIKIYLDFKDGNAVAAWKLIRKKKMQEEVVVYINQEHQFTSWRKAAPNTPLMISLPDSIRDQTDLSLYLDIVDAEILDGGVEAYTSAMIAVINKFRRSVWVDVQGDNEGPDTWEKAIRLGVHGVQTDYPQQFLAWLKDRTEPGNSGK